MSKVQLYDTTLRDGSQEEGISFSVEDKLKIVTKLDELGIDYIEGGWPGSNPKDTEFFNRVAMLPLVHTTLVAFGSTRRAYSRVDNDDNLRALLEAKTKVVTLVGKGWDKHVTQVLETTLEEHLDMIKDSIAYLTTKGRRVFFDAEHFFDGYRDNAEYALAVVTAAASAGAECVILCDTNGGSLPHQIIEIIKAVQKASPVSLGIHAHNDSDLGVANSLAAIEAGVVQVQGTINGYGERCGNANLCSVIPNMQLKLGLDCVGAQLSRLTEVSHYVSEIANLAHYNRLPYVGDKAFTHKGGIHVSALAKWEDSYQHISPKLVGNYPRVIISDLAGKSSIMYKARERKLPIPKAKQVVTILKQIKLLEKQGFQYDSAEASFDLLLYRAQPSYRPPFELVDFMVVVEKWRRPHMGGDVEEPLAEAIIKVRVDSKIVHTAAEGHGPVNALDQALRKALVQFYPDLDTVTLIDYKVRILEETAGTASQTRVLIESGDGKEHWRTVGSSSNIIEASWLALVDSIEYWLVKNSRTRS
jgi:2-isopropylmalate synthase